MNLLPLIPHGKENAVSRAELAMLTGENDRKIRLEIKRLLKQGHPILSSSSVRGYWYSEDKEEIKEFLRESDSRRRTEYSNTESLRKLMESNSIPYFPLMCQFDDKFELIETEFEPKGFAVVVKLYQKIYGTEGYYCEWAKGF